MRVNLKHLNKLMLILKVNKSLKFAIINLHVFVDIRQYFFMY